MPFFGVDDILFLLASTTALLWAKRADVVECGVYTTVKLFTDDSEKASERAAVAAATHGGTPNLLLRGFDLQAEDHGLLLSLEGHTHAADTSSSTIQPSAAGERRQMDEFMKRGSPEEDALFVKESVHEQFREATLLYQAPQVPHRHYNPRKRQQHVSWLATASEEDVRDRIGRYTVPEVQTLFDKMEREGMWESVIHVTYGVEQAHAALRYLNLHNVECAIRTLLNTAHADAALVYYFRFGEDVLLSDDILVALFHACRHDAQLSLELCHVLEPFKPQWTPTVYACCLTTTARFDYTQAVKLYHAYMDAQRSRLHSAQHKLRRVLAASSLLRETGIAAGPETEVRLHYLFHIIIPLVVEHDPASAESLVDDMLDSDPHSAPDVFLKCLTFAKGRELARDYLLQLRHRARDKEVGLKKPDDSSVEAATVKGDTAPPQASAASPKLSEIPETVGELALCLYRMRPSAMNMNTLLKLLTEYSMSSTGSTTVAAAKPPHVSAASAVARRCASMDKLCSGASPDLARLLYQVPLHTELDASVWARTITEQHAAWGLATQFLSVMLRRKCFSVVPAIAAHVARQERWATAAKSMAIYLSNQRAAMTTAEATLCVEASVHSGQWASALFWVERAHAKKLALAPSTYDLVLAASRHCQFEAAERVMTTMYDVGASCTEHGVLNFIESAAHQGKVANAFRVLHHHSNVEWTP